MTALIPPAEYRCPYCPLCGRETEAEDGAVECKHCRVGWSSRAYWSPGYRLDPEKPQCIAAINPWTDTTDIAHVQYRCLLNHGHTGKHLGGRVDQRSDLVHEWKQS